MQITVRDNNVDQALKILKKLLQREGVFKELKERRYYRKPSAIRAELKRESDRRYKGRKHRP